MHTLLQGDALTVLRTLPDRHFHTCVTSPPYFNLRNYQTGGWVGGDPACEHRGDRRYYTMRGASMACDAFTTAGEHNAERLKQARWRESGRCRCGAAWVDQQIGLEATPEAYVARLVEVFHEVKRVLRDDATFWLNIGDSYSAGGRGLPNEKNWKQNTNPGSQLGPKSTPGFTTKQLLMIPAKLAIALQADGWYVRSDIIWHKPSPMPESVKDRPTSSHEHVFLLAKSSRYFYDQDAIREPLTGCTDPITGFGDVAGRRDGGRVYERDGLVGANARNVWRISPKPFRGGAHFATMPVELAERCIKAGSSSHGCCGFCGAPWRRVTPSWQPTCQCEAEVVPCRVLDPFGGAGTTGYAAIKHGRDPTLIELNAEYVEIARNRLVIAAG